MNPERRRFLKKAAMMAGAATAGLVVGKFGLGSGVQAASPPTGGDPTFSASGVQFPSFTVDPTALIGNMWYRSDLKAMKYSDGTNAHELAALDVANTWTALQTFEPATSVSAIALLGEQTTSATAMVNVIYTSTDGNGVVAGTYPFIQMTAGGDLFIGVQAGNSNVGTAAQDNGNTGVGFQSLLSVTTGFENSFFGQYSGSKITTGARNSGFGESAGFANTTGNDDSAFGNQALQTNTTGSQISALGSYALYSFNDTAGALDNLVAIGYKAGYNYTGTERNDIVIGASLLGVAGESNVLRIGTGTTLIYGSLPTSTTSAGGLTFGKDIAATSTTTLVNGYYLESMGAYWNSTSTASVPYGFRLLSVTDSTTPTAHLSFNLNDNGTLTELVKLDQTGALTLSGNGIVFGAAGSIASTSTYIEADGAGGNLYLNAAGNNRIFLQQGGATQVAIVSGGMIANADDSQYLGVPTDRWLYVESVLFNVRHASGDANPSAQLGDEYLHLGPGGGTSLISGTGIVFTPVSATSTSTLQNSLVQDLFGSYWNGTASVPYGFRLYSVQDSTTPTAHLSFNLNNNGTITELLKLTQAGVFSLYNKIGTVGLGVPAEYASTLTTAVAIGTTSTVIKTYTPAADGQFLVVVSVEASVASTLSSLTVTYTDATSATATTQTLATSVAVALNNAVTFTALCNATTATAISVQATAAAATDLYASATVLAL